MDDESPDPLVSVVIPSLDGRHHLEMVLPSLEGQSYGDFDVTVVDNGSSDDSLAYLASGWPRLRVVALPKNLGFAGAVNRGIAATNGRYVALLNNDMECDHRWLENLARELDRDPRLGFATSKILRHGDRGIVDCAWIDYYTYGRLGAAGSGLPDDGSYELPRPTTSACGGAAIFRRVALDEVGGFDEDFGFYWEDIDACLRMVWAGWRGSYVPAAIAYHIGRATAGQDSDFTRFHMARNQIVTLLKNAPAGTLWRNLLEIALFQIHQYKLARTGGFTKIVRKVYRSSLRALPATLRKRRETMQRRTIRPSEFESMLRNDYEIETMFRPLLERKQLRRAAERKFSGRAHGQAAEK